jgi:hypothetical protein
MTVTTFIVARAEDEALLWDERSWVHFNDLGQQHWAYYVSLVRANRVARRFPGAVVAAIWPIWEDEPAREGEHGDLLREAS